MVNRNDWWSSLSITGVIIHWLLIFIDDTISSEGEELGIYTKTPVNLAAIPGNMASKSVDDIGTLIVMNKDKESVNCLLLS